MLKLFSHVIGIHLTRFCVGNAFKILKVGTLLYWFIMTNSESSTMNTLNVVIKINFIDKYQSINIQYKFKNIATAYSCFFFLLHMNEKKKSYKEATNPLK